ncbi:conjugative transposon protein TraK [Cytophagaceae bacterium YF14B1]|uniref:Conjugative transposon protein TraK n=1 Tax=Xanthocytophaga flava TaxID=3048013 RepID=A0AAE3U4U6_9BACT|nr:conjugative transposon protein TraK [Xanthocytophaga flavus]MDJ1478847.1 conjugative transposon protein TraK [Xanthocytophaga flavus]
MFTKIKHIDTAFQYVRGFTLLVILACLLIVCFALYKSYQLVKTMQSRIYILADGKVLEAYASDRKDNIPVEAKDHIRSFHQLFFTLDPDDKVIEGNITKALYLADGSVKREYDNLKENGYYSGLISGNISQKITIDSIVIDLEQHPYSFHCYATQRLIRATSTVHRSLVTQGVLRNVARSDNNPHGFLIERWKTLENKDIKVENH